MMRTKVEKSSHAIKQSEASMSKIKGHLYDIYGEDWSSRLNELALRRQKARAYGRE